MTHSPIEIAFVVSGDDRNFRLGVLNVDMSARFLINDGQHRRAAIEHAMRERPEIGDETIAVVFFIPFARHRSPGPRSCRLDASRAPRQRRAFLGGHVSKARQNIILTTNALKQHLGLPLTPEEKQTEEAYRRGSHVEAS